MRTALHQQHRDIYLNIWAWIYANSNAHNVYYGTMKEICEGCQIKYEKLNRAFKMQNQWNTEAHEKTIVLRKDDSDFSSYYNHFEASKYFQLFGLNITLLRSQYKPIIIIFNSIPYADLKPPEITTNVVIDEQKAQPKITNKKRKKEEKTIPKKDIEKELQDACLDVYIEFYKNRTGVKPMLNGNDSGAQIKALQEMIRYFRTTDNYKNDNDVILAFDLIFQNWNLYTEWYQGQLKLTQIKSNLVNLIGIIKSNPKQVEKSKSTLASEHINKFNALVLSGAFTEKLEKLGKK